MFYLLSLNDQIRDLNAALKKLYQSGLFDKVELTPRNNSLLIRVVENKKIGKLDWIEYRELKKGAEAFKQIHDGTCSSPKIVLLP